MLSQKYSRTYHFLFSPGTTSDDRINHMYWEYIQKIETLIHTEKLEIPQLTEAHEVEYIV